METALTRHIYCADVQISEAEAETPADGSDKLVY